MASCSPYQKSKYCDDPLPETYHFEQELQHLFKSLESPLFLLLVLCLQVQDPLETTQRPLGVVFLQPLGTVVLVFYLYLVIICRSTTLVCVILDKRRNAQDTNRRHKETTTTPQKSQV